MKLATYSFAACFASLAWLSIIAAGEPDKSARPKAEAPDRPFLAIWRQDDAMFDRSDAPYLRFAVWEDGRVLFARDPSKWGGELQRGKIAPYRVARLKEAIAGTGVFKLTGTAYLVPDAPRDCIMVDLGGKEQQMLYWDEVEAAGYGINVDPQPQHIEFKRCWKAINSLALLATPDQVETVKEKFQPPQSWNLKPAIESK